MASTTPTEIEKVGNRHLQITWDDGHVSVYRYPELRFACACASCVEEITGERRITRQQIPDNIIPVGLELVGRYALQITWSDGHATGIYTFERLRAMNA